MEAIEKKHQGPDKPIDVLIIGETDHKQLSEYLEEYDVSFIIAFNEEGAIKNLRDFTFKLVLIDIDSPDLAYCKIVAHIKNELLLNIPIVAIIADGGEEMKKRCFDKGINGCFTRPISKIELVGVLTQFLTKEVSSEENIQTATYRTIDLGYLKEISMGNADFEREMAGKFFEIIAEELIQLNNDLGEGNYEALKRTVHKMKSTIYLMGLKPKLSAAIEAIEYDQLNHDQFRHHVDSIVSVCEKAKEEVQLFLNHTI
ncbi:hypothetical protein [Pedobacter roseus]|uniref:Response regulatory domain-containing protein n=1 Tax=Pedobacter roseus TaxID=336820 RepID=A0A7G9QAR1_9SPHI|nr:hypothetical protein [Pedobacter roseus]QNN40436.1 hypothetical protein H9L23_14905 [Pedobacter roseus]